MSGFAAIPQSSDPDALPAKALVTGTRDDGTPGVWEIQADDSIQLPQPEQSADNTARCMVGGDMSSLPEGIQLRYGWTFHTGPVLPGMIVGYAKATRDVTIGGVQIFKNSTVAVYWRVYSLRYSRFCIVAAPRIIGTVVRQPPPDGWPANLNSLSAIVRQLKLYFAGTLESYLMTATALTVDPSTGTYFVTGENEDSLPASAAIEKNGNVTVTVTVPDLSAESVAAVPAPAFTDTPWNPSAVVRNLGNATSAPVTLTYWLSGSLQLDTTSATPIATSTVPALNPNNTFTDTSVMPKSLKDRGFPAGTYYLFAVVGADSQKQEVNTSNNTVPLPPAPGILVSVTDENGTNPITYGDMVFETYFPTGAGPGGYNTMDLYGPASSTEIGLLITSDTAGANPNFRNAGFAYIVWNGLISGDYWVRIQGVNSTDAGPYALRVDLTAQGSEFTGYDTAHIDSPLSSITPDDTASGGPDSSAPTLTLGVPPLFANRFIEAGHSDWVKIHLP
jgi:hypothetical protein